MIACAVVLVLTSLLVETPTLTLYNRAEQYLSGLPRINTDGDNNRLKTDDTRPTTESSFGSKKTENTTKNYDCDNGVINASWPQLPIKLGFHWQKVDDVYDVTTPVGLLVFSAFNDARREEVRVLSLTPVSLFATRPLHYCLFWRLNGETWSFERTEASFSFAAEIHGRR